MLRVPIFYFSPTIFFLDDNKLFLHSLTDYFSDSYNVIVTSSPTYFIETLEKSSIQDNLLSLIDREDDYFSEQSMVSINLQNLAPKLIDMLKHKKPVSVAFIDFEMPKEDGLDVCNKITNTETKKVFLTGKLDEIGAIEAFNKGLIEAYLSKNSCNMVDQIRGAVEKLHATYLEELGNIYIPFIVKNHGLLSLYGDPRFVEFFFTVVNQNHIEQACVYEMFGSQILRDKNGCMYLLNVYEQEEIEALVFPHLDEKHPVYDFEEALRTFKVILDFKQLKKTEIPILEDWSIFITQNFSVIEVSKTRYFVTLKRLVTFDF
jgi:CheY-like chemotaxis protein